MAFNNLPNIPDVPTTGIQEQDEFFRAVKETLEKMQGKDPSAKIDQTALTELEVGARTGRDWPYILATYNGGNVNMPTPGTYYEVPWDNWYGQSYTSQDFRNPNYPLEYWREGAISEGLVIPEDGMYHVAGSGLVYLAAPASGGVSWYVNWFMWNPDSNRTVVSPATSTTGWSDLHKEIYLSNASADLPTYWTHSFAWVLNLRKGTEITVTVRQSSGLTTASYLNTNRWWKLNIAKIGPSGIVPSSGSTNYNTFERSTHSRPDRHRRETR